MEPKFGEVWQWDKGDVHLVVLIIGRDNHGGNSRQVVVLQSTAKSISPAELTNYSSWDDQHWQRVDV